MYDSLYEFSIENVLAVRIINRRGKVRRARLFYLRGLEGKATRIKERITPGK